MDGQRLLPATAPVGVAVATTVTRWRGLRLLTGFFARFGFAGRRDRQFRCPFGATRFALFGVDTAVMSTASRAFRSALAMAAIVRFAFARIHGRLRRGQGLFGGLWDRARGDGHGRGRRFRRRGGGRRREVRRGR